MLCTLHLISVFQESVFFLVSQLSKQSRQAFNTLFSMVSLKFHQSEPQSNHRTLSCDDSCHYIMSRSISNCPLTRSTSFVYMAIVSASNPPLNFSVTPTSFMEHSRLIPQVILRKVSHTLPVASFTDL